MNKEPLVGVNVTVKDKPGLGAITDINGRYKIKTEEFSRLVFSYIGFDTQEVLVKRQNLVNISMKESEAREIDEVVITGTGAQKKLTVTGAVTNVDVEVLKSNPTANLSNALAGNVSGVLAMQTSGQPGVNTSEFWIRGISTFGANSAALVLVDGFERDLDEINIEFISKLIDLIKSYKYIVMDTNLREDVLEYICKNCPNSKIIVDCVSRKKALKIKKLLKYIYLLKPNIYEAEELTDIPYENESDLEKIVNVFLEKGVQKIFISMGEKGILYADKNDNGIVKITEKPKIENTSGCGDSAMSGIIFGVVNEKDILECAKLGNIAGFITAQSMDTVSKDISEKNLLNFGGSYEIRKIFNS